ncbi:hypothetical protein CEUSTIGMA_g12490.t1 [Chlamydomonas eustigma]|uniref:Uncharacterized protein n=1 Tax=Chlamydomonas eustigma TaxID=1157962 RepID=A0A250XQJ5_9CHLO|nr:hypothetical protein CEUSTIGMA_g12490.t1 [Chlamydomonas eustigma]|eukprot:GAX85070.1 hypothetical protein CEUSTIGMA_g12490.t1 [Chlamydomonas eustigma]
MEKNPWWKSLQGPFPSFEGPVGVKPDGGGSIRGCGRVSNMALHQAVCNQDIEAIKRLVNSEGRSINEVEAAGNTPLHNAAYEGWLKGVQELVLLGAKVNASNNAGDKPWHWAKNMGHEDIMSLLEQHGATKMKGKVLVQEHIPKVKDFYSKDCWSHHPKPYSDFMEAKQREYDAIEADRKRVIK